MDGWLGGHVDVAYGPRRVADGVCVQPRRISYESSGLVVRVLSIQYDPQSDPVSQHPAQNPSRPTMIITKQNRRIIYENLFKGTLHALSHSLHT